MNQSFMMMRSKFIVHNCEGHFDQRGSLMYALSGIFDAKLRNTMEVLSKFKFFNSFTSNDFKKFLEIMISLLKGKSHINVIAEFLSARLNLLLIF